MEFIKNAFYQDENGKDLICLEKTDEFAFMCPVDLEKGVIDVAGVMCYSTTTGDTPIVQIQLTPKEPEAGE